MRCILFLLFLNSQVDALKLSRRLGEVAESGWAFGWKKVAIAYSGHHYKIGMWDLCPQGGCLAKNHFSWKLKRDETGLLNGGRGTADFRLTFPSHEANIFKPLANHGVEYDVYFHTWPSPISKKYIKTLKPRKFKIEKNGSYAYKIEHSPMSVLKLIDWEKYDAIILTRPDINLTRPLNTYSIDPSKINLPNRELSEDVFRQKCKTSDLMRVFPASYLPLYLTKKIDLFHYPINKNPWKNGSTDEFGCPYWRDHFNLMSDEYGGSGGKNPLGEISHYVLTDEHGPYHSYLGLGFGIRGSMPKPWA